MRRWLLVGIVLAASHMSVPTLAQAGILFVTPLTVDVIAPPNSVVSGALESDTQVRVFRELQNFVLPTAVEVDFTAPGHYDGPADLPSPSPFLAVGSRVDSYFFHADPDVGTHSYIGSVTFTTDILGVILFNPDSNPKLTETDALLGHPSTTYPAAGLDTRDVEFDGSDEVTLSADRRTLTFRLVTAPSPMDQFRVITAESFDVSAVPEPNSMTLAMISLLVGAGVGWRRRRRAG